MFWSYIYLTYIILMSFTTFMLYYVDKRKATKGKWRIKEVTLLLFSIFGGAAAGYLGMLRFHHKTKHWYFMLINIVFFAVQVAVAIILFKEGL